MIAVKVVRSVVVDSERVILMVYELSDVPSDIPFIRYTVEVSLDDLDEGIEKEWDTEGEQRQLIERYGFLRVLDDCEIIDVDEEDRPTFDLFRIVERSPVVNV